MENDNTTIELCGGNSSFVHRVGNRVHKDIKPFNQYGHPMGYYEEYKITKYASQLSTPGKAHPEFPQNVTCEGPFKFSYNYIPGVTLDEYERCNRPLSIDAQKDILRQLTNIFYKMNRAGITHVDSNLGNFIVSCDKVCRYGSISIIDFGMSIVRPKCSAIGAYRKPKLVHGTLVNTNTIHPTEEYELVDKDLDYVDFGGLLEELRDGWIISERGDAKSYIQLQDIENLCGDYKQLIQLFQ